MGDIVHIDIYTHLSINTHIHILYQSTFILLMALNIVVPIPMMMSDGTPLGLLKTGSTN